MKQNHVCVCVGGEIYLKIYNRNIYAHTYFFDISKLATVVEVDQKAPFSTATTPRGRVLLISLDCSTLASISTLYC